MNRYIRNKTPGSCVLAALLLSALSGAAHAESEDAEELAVQLRSEARELAAGNRWAAACKKLEASARQAPAFATYLQLGRCYEKLGKHGRAWRAYRTAAAAAMDEANRKGRAQARERAAALEPQLARIEIAVPDSLPEGFTIKWDGQTIEVSAEGSMFYADPGAHRLIASAPGHRAYARTIKLAADSSRRISIPELTGGSSDTDELATSEDVADEGELATPRSNVPRRLAPIEAVAAPLLTRRGLSIGLATTGLATIGSGIVFLARARLLYGDATALCGARLACSPENYDQGVQLVRDAKTSSTVSKLLIGAGGLATVAGAILYLTAPPQKAQKRLRLAPVPHERGGGLAVFGRF